MRCVLFSIIGLTSLSLGGGLLAEGTLDLLTLAESTLVRSDSPLGVTKSTLVQLVSQKLHHALLVGSISGDLTDDLLDDASALAHGTLLVRGALGQSAALE